MNFLSKLTLAVTFFTVPCAGLAMDWNDFPAIDFPVEVATQSVAAQAAEIVAEAAKAGVEVVVVEATPEATQAITEAVAQVAQEATVTPEDKVALIKAFIVKHGANALHMAKNIAVWCYQVTKADVAVEYVKANPYQAAKIGGIATVGGVALYVVSPKLYAIITRKAQTNAEQPSVNPQETSIQEPATEPVKQESAEITVQPNTSGQMEKSAPVSPVKGDATKLVKFKLTKKEMAALDAMANQGEAVFKKYVERKLGKGITLADYQAFKASK